MDGTVTGSCGRELAGSESGSRMPSVRHRELPTLGALYGRDRLALDHLDSQPVRKLAVDPQPGHGRLRCHGLLERVDVDVQRGHLLPPPP